MKIEDKIIIYLNSLKDGVEVKIDNSTPVPFGHYFVESRQLGFNLQGVFPVMDFSNRLVLQLNDFQERKITKRSVSLLFPYSLEIDESTGIVQMNDMTIFQVENFFHLLNERAEKIKMEFPLLT